MHNDNNNNSMNTNNTTHTQREKIWTERPHFHPIFNARSFPIKMCSCISIYFCISVYKHNEKVSNPMTATAAAAPAYLEV